MSNLIRFGVSIDEKLLTRFDATIGEKGYVNRSEAIRDLIRDMLVAEETSDPSAEAMGTLTLVYSHEVREIADKLNDIQHNYYGNIVSAVHVHLDEHNCLEVLSIKNVRHGKLTITSAGSQHA